MTTQQTPLTISPETLDQIGTLFTDSQQGIIAEKGDLARQIDILLNTIVELAEPYGQDIASKAHALRQITLDNTE